MSTVVAISPAKLGENTSLRASPAAPNAVEEILDVQISVGIRYPELLGYQKE
jgi:hypothetical protein